MKVSVLGCGRWGSCLAWYSAKLGHKVIIWGREESNTRKNLAKNRKNKYLTLPDSVSIESSLEIVLSSDVVIIAIGAQGLRDLCRQIASYRIRDKIFILCMKGLEETTGKRLTQVFCEEISEPVPLAIWVGPGHVQEFIKDVPSCMVISSNKMDTTKRIVDTFKSDLIRFYYSEDVIGNEIGAASKNVMGIAAGMLDGLGLSSLKGPLMARGPQEISRLVRAMGGNELTVYGLCHIGDYAATLFSNYSRNRKFGEVFVNGERFDKLAEGVSTAGALMILSKRYNVELPICEAVYNIIKNGQEPRGALRELFLRPIKYEFY
ncbi:MAG: NAD(P)H-dependent glycerol-3-phosphate dehydrogenase [Candidatus Aerophobetes bacterium]|nr:NAD(P)H-dependent glycerol-3-phosphate dehydrogenase [Candidatus Aerophobetes bacterium]